MFESEQPVFTAPAPKAVLEQAQAAHADVQGIHEEVKKLEHNIELAKLAKI